MEIYENLRLFKILKRSPKDYLKPLLTMTYGLMKFKYMKHVLIPSFVVHCFSVLFSLSASLDIHFIMKYGPAWGIEAFMLINVHSVMKKLEEFKAFFKLLEESRIPYEVMGKKMNRKFKMLSKLAIVIVLFNYGFACICGFLLVLSTFFSENSYIRMWMCKELPGECWFKITIMNIVDVVAAIAMVSCPTALFYGGISGIFRLMMIHEFVKTICSSHIPLRERYTSQLYQKLVQQRLKICVMMHSQGIKISIVAARMIYMEIIVYFMGSILMWVSVMLGIKTAYSEGNNTAFLGLLFYGLCSLICATLYISIGQILKDQSELIWYHLTQLPWYYMNKSNMNIYSIFLRRSAKPIALSTDLLEINFLVFVRIFRALYSVAALVLRLSPSTG